MTSAPVARERVSRRDEELRPAVQRAPAGASPRPSRAPAPRSSRRRRCGGRRPGRARSRRPPAPHLVGLGVEGVVGQVVVGHGPERVDADGERRPRRPRSRRRISRPHLGGEVQPRGRRRRRSRRCARRRSGSRRGDRAAGGCTAAPASPRSARARLGSSMAPGSVTVTWPSCNTSATQDRTCPRRRASRPRADGGRAGRARPRRRRRRRSRSSNSTAPPVARRAWIRDAAGRGCRSRRRGRRAGARRAGRQTFCAGSARVRAVVHQEPRARARLGRLLGDQVGGKVVVELGGAHRREYRRPSDAHVVQIDAVGRARRVQDAGPRQVPHAPCRSTARMWMWPPRHDPFTWKSIFADPVPSAFSIDGALDRGPGARDDAQERAGPARSRAGRWRRAETPAPWTRSRSPLRPRCRGGREEQDGAEDERDPRTRLCASMRGLHHRPAQNRRGSRAGARQPQVRVAGRRDDAAARRALEQAQLEQERLVDVLDRVGLLADRHGQRREADRPAREPPGDRLRIAAVDPLEADARRPRTARAPPWRSRA